MIATEQQTNSFVLAEEPVISGVCTVCGASVKQTIDSDDKPINLSIGYRIRTIFFKGGRTFEKVNSSFLHDCRETFPTQPDSLRGASLGEPALL